MCVVVGQGTYGKVYMARRLDKLFVKIAVIIVRQKNPTVWLHSHAAHGKRRESNAVYVNIYRKMDVTSQMSKGTFTLPS